MSKVKAVLYYHSIFDLVSVQSFVGVFYLNILKRRSVKSTIDYKDLNLLATVCLIVVWFKILTFERAHEF